MTTLSQNGLDLSGFPDMAKSELMTFYDFLVYKYNLVSTDEKRPNSKEPRFARFLDEPVSVTHWKKYSREELHAREELHER